MKSRDHALANYGPRTLLRQDDDGHWRPVLPQARHRLTPDRYREQMAAFKRWKNSTTTTDEVSSRPCISPSHLTENTDHGSAAEATRTA